MILAKARLIDGSNGHLRIGLSFPTGFDPEEVVQDSLKADATVPALETRCAPRRGNINDIYREFEVSFPSSGTGTDGTIRITGKFRRGLSFTASLSGLPPSASTDH